MFDALNAEFGFTLDAAATRQNAKCKKFSAKSAFNDDIDFWASHRVFINPPYSGIEKWVEAAINRPNFCVMLLPVRTDNNWFCWLNESPHVTIRYFRKRIAFISNGVPKKDTPFASMVVIVNG